MPNVNFNCSKAFNKLKGNYRWIITEDSAIIGVTETSHTNPQGSSISMKQLVKILTKGNKHIPARPFFSDFSSDKNPTMSMRTFLLQLIKRNVKIKKVKSTSPDYVADIYITLDTDVLAKQALSQLKEWLMTGTYYRVHVPNAPGTILKKGHDTPLYETGQLINSLYAQTKSGGK